MDNRKVKPEKFILDATAGYRMMWWDKQHPETVYMDQRKSVKPDIVARWQNLPFIDGCFNLIVWDPPHTYSGPQGIFREKFGVLNPDTWHYEHYKAFKEFRRVLKDKAFLILKWNDASKNVNKIINMADGWRPMFGHKTAFNNKNKGQTLWFCFMKKPEENK